MHKLFPFVEKQEIILPKSSKYSSWILFIYWTGPSQGQGYPLNLPVVSGIEMVGGLWPTESPPLQPLLPGAISRQEGLFGGDMVIHV